ncbi:MAG: DegT/DnrJ/EryC1/StrS family aminotransferase, partial [Candidatus Hydrogenedentota bacterium]
MSAKIPHSAPTLGAEEAEAASRIIASGRVAQGAETEAFEKECAEFVGRGYGGAVSSGTAALHLALKVAGMGEGKYVAIPSYACAALVTATHMAGARAALCDCAADFNVPKRKYPQDADAAIVAHLFGKTADFPDAGCIVEDIAQSIGGGTGRTGKTTICSFYATKLMTTGEGGVVLTDDVGVAEELRDMRDYDNRDVYQQRFAYKMTDLQAAIGRVQLRRLPGFIARRREIAERYAL